MIRVEQLYKSFEGRQILNHIDLEVERGKTNMVIGKSGSGKSVLLKCIVGLHKPDSGSVWFDDINFTNVSVSKQNEIRKNIGMLFQGSALFDSATVEENVMFPLNMYTKMSNKEKLDRVNFCLERVEIRKSNHLFPAEISGGMQKRVAIARAIVMNPKFLFCDEPNSGLDPSTSIVIDNLIKEITTEYNITTLVITHDMNSVMEIGDKVTYIHLGNKWWEGTNQEIFHTDNPELNGFVFPSELMRTIKEEKKK